jgi:hypothetical protein
MAAWRHFQKIAEPDNRLPEFEAKPISMIPQRFAAAPN